MTIPARNRDDTRARILDAGLALLSAQGFGGFGVNAVARAAGCDKQLIYRYFDGLDGLIRAMGETVAERLALALSATLMPAPVTYAALMERLALALYAHLASNAVWRQFKVMEMTAPSGATEAFRQARGAALRDWMVRARGTLTPPEGMDSGAINAALIAAVEGLAVLGPAGLDPAATDTPDRLHAAIRHLVRAAYGA